MKKNLYREFLQTAKVVVLAVLLSVGVTYIEAAWSDPSATPPNGNIDVPVNIGTAAQVKNGALSVTGFSNYGGSYFSGNVGIGSSSPAMAKLVISGTTGGQGLDLSSTDQYANLRVIQNTNSGTDKDLYLGFNSGGNSRLHLYSNNIETATVRSGGFDVNGSIKISGGSPQTNKVLKASDSSGNAAWGSPYTGCTVRTASNPPSNVNWAAYAAVATCDAGEAAIAGGGSCNSSSPASASYLGRSCPSTGSENSSCATSGTPTAWSVHCASAGSVNAYVVCCPNP